MFILVYDNSFKDFIHEIHRKREVETQAEGETGSMQGAWHGTRSWVSRIRPWAEGGATPLSHPGCPTQLLLLYFLNAKKLLPRDNLSTCFTFFPPVKQQDLLLEDLWSTAILGLTLHFTIKAHFFKMSSDLFFFNIFKKFLFIYDSHREREAET